MRADLLDWGEVLDHARAGLEEAAFGRERAPGDSVIVGGEAVACHFVLVLFSCFFRFQVLSSWWLCSCMLLVSGLFMLEEGLTSP